MSNGCNRLVGGTDGFAPSVTSGASVCKLGAGGVLTASSTPDATRELVAFERICAIGKYMGLGFTPWDGVAGPAHRQQLTSASSAADIATFSYLNPNYLFCSCTNLASISGPGNL